ncbi:MAG: hypothetical protein HKL88_00240 [Bacteroidia bacterium]|nr:hypothetical protein [Bacteroidia bacterium]
MQIKPATSPYAAGEYSDNRHFAKQYKGLPWLTFWLKVGIGFACAYIKLWYTILVKKCSYGPFKGEFGHFLAHNLPFLMYLHIKGVKINYCGMELHKPFLVDESGNSIISEFTPLRDFFSEVRPSGNSTKPPADVQEVIKAFENKSKYPFWNIGDEFYYWFIHRNFLIKGPYMKTYNLEKVYGGHKDRNVVIFPRKQETFSDNNGGPWDYMEIARAVSPYFKNVYITGHPAMSVDFKSEGNIELCLSGDNRIILEKCSNSQLIITPHSGVNNLGEYTNTKVLIIYNGKPPIGSMQNTLRFRPYIGSRHDLDFAFSLSEIITYAKSFNFKPNY